MPRPSERPAPSAEGELVPVPLSAELAAFRASADYAAMRRFARVHAILAAALPAAARGKVRAVALRRGCLTLEVSDGVLLAELRSTIARALRDALAAAGTGVSQLQWRVAPRRDPAH
ncbi:MAG: hypothetical protein RMM29_08280 [Planctomycetota bacterium]|nr:DciA family protein [Planctomycetota bacterium]MCX8039209.1 DciA family protein [Planctomycetota bacterium]MDW8373624.1 hypothetical protein [Planctomycetota bacterium]